MADFMKAIKRPFSNWLDLLIGALMYMIPFVSMITMFFGSGYTLECAKSSFKNDLKLPKWNKWGNIWVSGFLAFLIALIYFIPFIIVFLIVMGTAILTGASGLFTGNPAALMAAFGAVTIGAIILIIIGLITSYIVPMAIMFFVDKGNFGAAFQFGKIFKKIFTGPYLVTWLVILIYGIVLGIIAGLLSGVLAVTVVLPWIINGFFNITIGITAMTAFGLTYRELRG